MTPRIIHIARGTIAFLLMIFTSFSLAHNNVVVIPLSGDDLNPLANIVTVAKQNGDFTNPVSALASITDASSDNPYLLVIAPGVYDLGSEQLVMKEYVEIAGSGQNATVLRGSVGDNGEEKAPAAFVLGANNAGIRSLSIENVNDGSSRSIGLHNDSASPIVSDVTIDVSGSSANSQLGVIYENASSPKFSNVTVILSGATGTQYGFIGSNSTPTLTDVRIDVFGGTSGGQFGVYNSSNTSIFIANTTISVSDGSSRYGVYNSNTTASARIRNSTISASTTSVAASTGAGTNETYISDTIVSNQITGDPKCSFTFLSSGTELSSTCSELE